MYSPISYWARSINERCKYDHEYATQGGCELKGQGWYEVSQRCGGVLLSLCSLGYSSRVRNDVVGLLCQTQNRKNTF